LINDIRVKNTSMNIITHNPFRILGLIGNATERELQKQISTIKAFARVGKTKSFNYDFEFVGDLFRNVDNIQQAANQIKSSKHTRNCIIHCFGSLITHLLMKLH